MLEWWERLQSFCRFGRPRYVIDIETRVDDRAMLAILDRKTNELELHDLQNSS
jgi:hypothetical protein